MVSRLTPRKGTETTGDNWIQIITVPNSFTPNTPQGDGNQHPMIRYDLEFVVSRLTPRKGTETSKAILFSVL